MQTLLLLFAGGMILLYLCGCILLYYVVWQVNISARGCDVNEKSVQTWRARHDTWLNTSKRPLLLKWRFELNSGATCCTCSPCLRIASFQLPTYISCTPVGIHLGHIVKALIPLHCPLPLFGLFEVEQTEICALAVVLLVRPEVPTITRGGRPMLRHCAPAPTDGGAPHHTCRLPTWIYTALVIYRAVCVHRWTDGGGGGAHTRGKAKPAIR